MRRLVLLLPFLAACVPVPVEWDAGVVRTPGALADSLMLDLDASLAPRFVPRWSPPSWPSEPAPCLATRRAATSPSGISYASWFSVRPDSSVVLSVARSDDRGVTWRAPVVADSGDGIRPGPAADATGGGDEQLFAEGFSTAQAVRPDAPASAAPAGMPAQSLPDIHGQGFGLPLSRQLARRRG